jgi:hypothetical protein
MDQAQSLVSSFVKQYFSKLSPEQASARRQLMLDAA